MTSVAYTRVLPEGRDEPYSKLKRAFDHAETEPEALATLTIYQVGRIA